MKKTYVIIGSSASGMAALATLKRIDSQAHIICITKESGKPYNKCLLTSFVAQAKKEHELWIYSELYSCLDSTEFISNSEVVNIQRDKKTLYFSDGRCMSYDKLLLATGSSAVVPQDLYYSYSVHENIVTFHTLQDAQFIKNYISHKCVKHAVIIGGGLTGLECADALLSAGLQVSIIEQKGHLLSHILDKAASDWLIAHAPQGFCFYSHEKVVGSNSNNNKITHVLLSSGLEIPAQLVIIAAGSKPATDLAFRAGINMQANGAISTDSNLRTNDSAIFAAGDCAEVKNKITQHIVQSTLWPDAVIQGITAAYNMAGDIKHYEGLIPYSSSRFNGIPFVLCGTRAYDSSCQQKIHKNTNTRAVIYTNKEGKIQGFVIMGHTSIWGSTLKKLFINQENFSLEMLL